LIVPDEFRREEAEILQRVAGGETVPHFETRRRRRDGSLIEVSATVSPIFGEGGRVAGAAKTLRDITERKRVEERFRLAVQASPTAMLMVDSRQAIALANRKAEQLFGYSGEELLGMALETLVPANSRSLHARPWPTI
jgi:PAS domain-containing protein